MAAPKAPYIGKKTGKVDLDEAVFGERFHGPLVHEAVRAELAAKRGGNASTKTRGEIAMTGAKAWRQKGTGRARVGALSAGQRTGGGVTFGPRPRGYTMKVNRKARKRALRAALTQHAELGSLAALDVAAFDAPSTKQAVEALAGFTPSGSTGGDGGKALVVLHDGEDVCAKSFRNIRGAKVLQADQVGVADLLDAARLIVSEAALERLTRLAA